MKKIVVLVVMMLSTFVCAQGIKGCTSDVRTGVCNKVCSLQHVGGCTFEQFKPLFLIQNMDCVADAKGEAARAVCEDRSDRLLRAWKDAQKKPAK